jgi:copper ion binding protein
MQTSEAGQKLEGWQTREIGVTGMTCDHCARRVEKALGGLPGVKEVRVNRSSASASVTYDAGQVQLADLRQVLAKVGYPAPASAS